MAVDYEKAFDEVEWMALFASLEKFGFGPNFISYIKICLDNGNFQNSVMNGGHCTGQFKVTWGIKQGCPLLPYLFLTMIEIITLKIKQNPKIKGLQVGEITKTIGQFTDNLWVVSQFEEESFNAILKTLKDYGINTGLKINYNKTEIL